MVVPASRSLGFAVDKSVVIEQEWKPPWKRQQEALCAPEGWEETLENRNSLGVKEECGRTFSALREAK